MFATDEQSVEQNSIQENILTGADLDMLKVLYSAPLRPQDWQTFLSLLCERVECKHGFFLCADSTLGLSVRAQGDGIFEDTTLVTAYNEHYSGSDPFRRPVVRDSLIGVFDGDELLPNEGLLQSKMYSDQLEPRGLRYATLLITSVSIRRLECISLWRTKEQGPISESSRAFLESLFPHIQSALEIRQVVNVAKQRTASAELMIDASATATLLITKLGEVVHYNAAARALFADGDCLRLNNGSLVVASPASREGVWTLIRKMESFYEAPGQLPTKQAVLLDRLSGQVPLHLVATPLNSADRERTHADIVLLVSDPAAPVHFPNQVLHSLYKLTSAQTEVANGLLTGYSIKEIAELRHVSVGTVRQQLKVILEKTGTVRQGDLIRLLLSIPNTRQ
jgi:DNA-binding CsgD family transcriptional regulator